MEDGGTLVVVLIVLGIGSVSGFAAVFFPSIVYTGITSWLLFGIWSWIVKQFSGKSRDIAARIIGFIFGSLSLIILIVIIVVMQFMTREEFIHSVQQELWKRKFPYDIRFTDGYNVKISLPDSQKPDVRMNLESYQELSGDELAQMIIEKGDEQYGLEYASLPPDEEYAQERFKKEWSEGMKALFGEAEEGLVTESQPEQAQSEHMANQGGDISNVAGGPGLGNSQTFPPVNESSSSGNAVTDSEHTSSLPGFVTPDLETADMLIEDANEKWAEKKYDASLKCAQQALEIKQKILGEQHEEVVKVKLMITNAKLWLSQQGLTSLSDQSR